MAKMIALTVLLTCVTLGGSARLKQKAAKLQSISEVAVEGGKVCNVVEKTGSDRVQYGLDFSFDQVGGGCNALKCSPYKFLIEVVPTLFKIEDNAPDEDPNTCHCASSNLKGKSDGDTWQFDFMVHPSVPERKECSPTQCWQLYTYALYIAKRSELGGDMSVTDQPSRPDHWDVGCVDRSQAAQNKGLPEVGSIIQRLLLEGKKGNTVKKNAAKDIKRMINVKKFTSSATAKVIKLVQEESPVQHVTVVKEDKESPNTPDPGDAERVTDELLSKVPASKRPKREEVLEEVKKDLVRENALADEIDEIGIGAAVVEPENLPSLDNVLVDAVMIERRGVFCSSITKEGLTCRNIDNEEDCGKAKEMANIDAVGDLKVFNNPQDKYPRSCFVHALYSKGSFYHHVWWNPSEKERPAVPRTKRSGNKGAAWYLMCGCYKTKQEPKVSLPVLKEAVEEVVEFEPVVKPAHMQAASVEERQQQDENIIIPDQEDLPDGNQEGVITTVDEKETVDLSVLPPETHVESPLANCRAKTEFWAQASCFCSLANKPEFDGDECDAMNKIVLELNSNGDYDPWTCMKQRVRRSKKNKKTYPVCAANLNNYMRYRRL